MTTTSSSSSSSSSSRQCDESKPKKTSHKRTIVTLALLTLLTCTFLSSTADYLLSHNGITLLDPYPSSHKHTHTHKRTVTMTPQEIASHGNARIANAISNSTSFAVVINTYKRPDMLKDALHHYVHVCGKSVGISQVFVVWAELDVTPPNPNDVLSEQSHLRSNKKKGKGGNGGGNGGDNDDDDGEDRPTVEFIRVPKDSLNSRFLPIEHLDNDTESVFMVDDDLRVDCAGLKTGFEAWRHHPRALVGYYPRLASPALASKGTVGVGIGIGIDTDRTSHSNHGTKSDSDSSDEEEEEEKKEEREMDHDHDHDHTSSSPRRIYHTWPIVYAQHKFNIILTKASFFHKQYLTEYFDDDINPKKVLEYVDEHKNCEDIAMAFMIARLTKKDTKKEMDGSGTTGYCHHCPVYVQGHVKDEGLFNGISTGGGKLAPKGHMEKRSKCIDKMVDIYETRGWKYPLVDVKLGDMSWKHHLFRYQYSPSNLFEWFSFGNTLT